MTSQRIVTFKLNLVVMLAFHLIFGWTLGGHILWGHSEAEPLDTQFVQDENSWTISPLIYSTFSCKFILACPKDPWQGKILIPWNNLFVHVTRNRHIITGKITVNFVRKILVQIFASSRHTPQYNNTSQAMGNL